MAVKLEKIVKTYYEKLEEGKVMGRKCPVCGNVEWPPVYACNACGSLVTEWYEMSGKGNIVALYMPTQMSAKIEFKDLEPYAYAWVKTEEGPERSVMVRNITKENESWIRSHMPYPVHMEIVQRKADLQELTDGKIVDKHFEHKTAVFAIDPINADGTPAEIKKETVKEEKPVQAKETAPAAAPAAQGKAETIETIKKLVAKAYSVDIAKLSAATDFDKDLKAPSVVFVGLAAQLEDEFDVLVSITEASAAKTIGGLAALIDARVNGEEAAPEAPKAAAASTEETAIPAVSEESETLKKIKEMVAKSYGVDIATLSADTNFDKDLKAPSVVFVGLTAKLEDEFDVMVSITEASAAKTIGGLAALVDSLM